MEAFLVSVLVVGLVEIGDKTQILSLMFAARFLRPVPIIFGILCATLANHAAAGLAGTFFGRGVGAMPIPGRCRMLFRNSRRADLIPCSAELAPSSAELIPCSAA